jgi:hypothetical protein
MHKLKVATVFVCSAPHKTGLLIVFFVDQIQKSFLCAPVCTASQTCTSAHIRAFYDRKRVL